MRMFLKRQSVILGAFMCRFLLLCWLVHLDLYAQTLSSSVSKDRFFVGEPIEYTVERISAKQDRTVLYTGRIKEPLNILFKKHTVQKAANGAIKHRYAFLITSYEVGKFVLPALPMLVNSSQIVYTKPAPLEVEEPFVDLFKKPLYEVKDLLYEPILWWERLLKHESLLIILTLLILTGAFGSYLFFRKGRKNYFVQSITPYKRTLIALETINLDENHPKAFYQALMRILKIYLYKEFNYDASRAFPAQIIEYLHTRQIVELKDLEYIREFFEQADLTKFGLGKPSLDQLERAREHVRNFIQAAHFMKEKLKRNKDDRNS